MASNYNSRPRVPEVLVRDGGFELVRERETYEDLLRGER
jgi:diaminopimelate decarboxylase